METCLQCKRLFKPDPIKAAIRDIAWPGCPLRCPQCSTLGWKEFQRRLAGMRANLEKEDM